MGIYKCPLCGGQAVENVVAEAFECENGCDLSLFGECDVCDGPEMVKHPYGICTACRTRLDGKTWMLNRARFDLYKYMAVLNGYPNQLPDEYPEADSYKLTAMVEAGRNPIACKVEPGDGVLDVEA